MRKYAHTEWHPFKTNVLDANKYDLCTPDGWPVEFRHDMFGFSVTTKHARFKTKDNLEMSAWMHNNEIGGVLKAKQEAS